MIQNPKNIINLDIITHIEISRYYSKVHPYTDGVSLHNWLSGQSFETQYQNGMEVLKLFGVI